MGQIAVAVYRATVEHQVQCALKVRRRDLVEVHLGRQHRIQHDGSDTPGMPAQHAQHDSRAVGEAEEVPFLVAECLPQVLDVVGERLGSVSVEINT